MSDHVPMPSAPAGRRRRDVASFVAVTAVGVAGAGVVAAVDPNEGGHYPTCPFLAITGLFCPGCGSLRTVHVLTQGDVPTALDRNPLAVILLPLLLAAWVMWGLRLAGRSTWSTTRLPARWIWGLLVVVLGYWALRNVPGWTWLSPL